MASLYKNRGIWYLTVCHRGNRISKSLGTKDKRVAKELKLYNESILIAEVNGFKKRNEKLNFPELVERFLKTEHGWAKSTYELNRCILRSHLLGKPLPTNSTSRAIHIRHINQCWSWGLKNDLVEKAYKIPGDTKGESRLRVFSEDELKLMFAEIKDGSFNAFVRFAYYTGARSGEIRRIPRENVLESSFGLKR